MIFLNEDTNIPEEFVPSIKNFDNEAPREIDLGKSVVVNDIIPPSDSESFYFANDFCMRKNVIDSVAKKYSADAKNYPEDDSDEEHFLLGFSSCAERKNLNCPYMKKFIQRLENSKGLPKKNIFAIYLLGADDSGDNKQKFLFMTMEHLYVLYATQQVERYKYSRLRFKADEIEVKDVGKPPEKILVEWQFDEKFLNFVHEFMLLRRGILTDTRERHPIADVHNENFNPDIASETAENLNIGVAENEAISDFQARSKYLRFLTDTAAAEGYIEARTILRLCNMAKEFKISGEDLYSWLKNALQNGGMKKLANSFTDMLKLVGVKNKFNFIQDIVEVATGNDGNFHREELLKILKRPQYGVWDFFEKYFVYVKKRNAAEMELQTVFRALDEPELNFKNFLRLQNYTNKINLQIDSMEGMLNEQ